jgi:hypothetical protein
MNTATAARKKIQAKLFRGLSKRSWPNKAKIKAPSPGKKDLIK